MAPATLTGTSSVYLRPGAWHLSRLLSVNAARKDRIGLSVRITPQRPPLLPRELAWASLGLRLPGYVSVTGGPPLVRVQVRA